MRNLLFFSAFLICCRGNSQTTDSTIRFNCNSKWLSELIKNDTISEKNRIQNYECYLGIFDSLNSGKKYSQSELYLAIGRLVKYSDGAFAESLGVYSYDLFTKDPKLFFENMKTLAKDSDYRCWALILFYESRIRFDGDIKPHEIIENLNIDEYLKSKKGYAKLEKFIYIIYSEHLQKK